jgi:predicted SAM-dependent methyltransferase
MPITRFLFDQLRREANAQLLSAANALLPWRRARIRRLRKRRGVFVNVASGPFLLSDFVNVDMFACAPEVVRWDCRWSLPFGDGACAGVRAEQFVEHLETREELPAFLADVLRVLRPGGVLRIIVPDAERYLRAYCTNDLSGFSALGVTQPFPADLPTRMDIVNHAFHQWDEHRWGYDYETLAHRLRTAGFSRIERSEFQKSLEPKLAQDRDFHAPYSLYVDAVK